MAGMLPFIPATTNDRELIEKLIQKDYLKKVLKDVKRELAAIEEMQKLYPLTSKNLDLMDAY